MGSRRHNGARTGPAATGPVNHHRADRAADVAVGELVIRGVAWSGAAPIKGVDIRIGDRPWQQARLVGDRQRHRWQWWELLTHLDEPGPATIRARATDLAGHTQPAQPRRNRLGYGGDAIHTVQLQLR